MGYTIILSGVWEEIDNEKCRQSELQKQGRFKWTVRQGPPGATVDADAWRLAVIAEEFGEVARHVNEAINDPEKSFDSQLRGELIQLAACCVGWIQNIDERT